MTSKSPEFHSAEEIECGLKLPNGTEIWPPETFHGRPLVTQQDRADIVEALRAAAVNMGKEPEDLLTEFHWVVRQRTHYMTVVWKEPFDMAITTEALIEVPPEPEPPVGNDTEDAAPDGAAVSDEGADNTHGDGGEPVAQDPEPEVIEPEGTGRHSA